MATTTAGASKTPGSTADQSHKAPCGRACPAGLQPTGARGVAQREIRIRRERRLESLLDARAGGEERVDAKPVLLGGALYKERPPHAMVAHPPHWH